MTLLLFILILSVLIFVHEFGHFIVAKKSGIKVEEFGFGLPPRIFGKKVGETIYSLNLLPIGGFVRLFGEDEQVDKKNKDEKRSFYHQSKLNRLSVLIAGVTMNLLLGIICFSMIYLKVGIPTKVGQVMVVDVSKNSPADLIGLQVNEIIYEINDKPLVAVKDFVEQTKMYADTEISLRVGNDRESRTVRVVPRINPPAGEGPLGVAISDTLMKRYPWWQTPYLVLREGLKEALSWSGNIIISLKAMVVGLVLHGRVPSDISGPIGIYQITGQAAKAGWMAVIQFTGILSINLAILNILPLPALDGGRIFFLGYEAITRRKINHKIELVINNIGMFVLIGLMVVITVNDVVRLLR